MVSEQDISSSTVWCCLLSILAAESRSLLKSCTITDEVMVLEAVGVPSISYKVSVAD